jgi:hypothetical protein
MTETDLWDSVYDELFDLRNGDKDELEQYGIISTIDPERMEDVTRDIIDMVNSTEFSLHGWSRFKYELLMTENRWPQSLFLWKTTSESLSMDVEWDVIKGDSRKHYIVQLAIENIWGLYSKDSPELPHCYDLLS